MKNKTLRRIAIGAVFVLSVHASHADVVVLSDGSRLVGAVERLGGGRLVLVTDFAGTLEIDAAKLMSIETDQTVNVALATGDRLVGPIQPGFDPGNPVVQTAMGGISVRMEQVEAIWPAGAKSPEVVAMDARVAEVQKAAEARAGKWSATLQAGITSQEGNTDTLDARGAAELRRTSDLDLLRFYVSGNYGEQNDERSNAEVKGGAYYEHLIGERFFAYGSTEAEYDEFENLDLRYTAVAGGGYYWIKRPEHELKTRAGLGYQHQSFLDGVTTDDAILDIGLDYRLDVTTWLQLVNSTTYLPTFESRRDYRIVSDTGVLVPLGDGDVWKLKLGALYEYSSIPRPGFEALDQTYYGNIVAELK